MIDYQKSSRYSRPESEEGFTLVEVLVALVLLSTLSLVVWAASFTGGRTLSKISAGISHNVELLEIDSAVRSYAQRVTLPYWLAGAKAESSDGGLSLPYLDGNPGLFLTLAFHDGMLTFGDGTQSVSFPDVQEARMEVSPPSEGAASALTLIVKIKRGPEIRIVAPLGGVPFPVAGL